MRWHRRNPGTVHMIVVCLVPVLGVGGCFGSRFESEGMHDMATKVRVEESIGIALMVTGGVLAANAREAEGLQAFGEATLAGTSVGIGIALVIHAEARHSVHVPRREALEEIERLRAEHPEISEKLGPPERLQKRGSGALRRLEAVERLRVEDPERFQRLRKELIAGLACLGGSVLVLRILESTFPEEREDWSFWHWAVYGADGGAMITGAVILMHYAYSTRSLRRPRSARFLLAPNGCALVCRF